MNTTKVTSETEVQEKGSTRPSDPSLQEDHPKYRSLSERANFLSYLTFFFMFRTAITAKRLAKQGKCLDAKTLPGIPYHKRPEMIEERFTVQIKKQKESRYRGRLNFALAIVQAIKWQLFGVILFQLTTLGLKILLVWVSMKLLESLSDMNASASDGYMWAGILSANLLLALYSEQHSYYLNSLLGLHIRGGIVSTVYTKIMRLSVYSINQISLGKLVNIVANDVNVFERTGIFFTSLITGLFGLGGSIALLWNFFGPSCLVGIGYCIVGFPIQQFLAKFSSKPRDKKNTVTDERVKVTSEVIDGIRLLKMYTWELIFRDIISKIRGKEIGVLKQVTSIESLSRGISYSTQAVASFLIWMTYVLTDHELTVALVFPSIFLIGVLKMYSVFFFSLGLNFVAEAKLLMQRLESVLEAPEVSGIEFDVPEKPENSIEFEKFNAFWTKDEADEEPLQTATLVTQNQLMSKKDKPTLADITLNIKHGSLNALIGKVGCGKSSFLLAFTGEMPRVEGYLRYKGTIAYVEQEPTIFAGTLRDNILFGKKYDREFYHKVVKACNLESDIALFPNGDLSEIGEKGVNLSGGQKARLTLARAVYSDADIYLLDDPLSAVDAKVAKSLYNDAIVGMLKGKTVILATHQVHFVKALDNIIVMDDGVVLGSGSYAELFKQGVDVNKIFNTDSKTGRSTVIFDKKTSMIYSQQNASGEEEEEEEENKEPKKEDDKGKLFSSEDAFAGIVNMKTYWSYIKQMGNPLFLLMLFLLYLSNELANVAFNRVLGMWAGGSFERSEALGIMGGITAYIFISFIIKNMMLSVMLLKSARSLHDKMIDKVVKSPSQFFDTNPVGRILNRFSNDLGVLDRFLPMTVTDNMDAIFQISSTFVTIAVINPILLAPIAVVLVAIVLILSLCYQSVKQARTYELSSRSPLFSLFSASLAGIIVIRSYKQTGNFVKKFRAFLYNNTKGSIGFWTTSRFFGITADLAYNLSAIASIFIVTATKNSNPGLSGLSISFILSICNILQYALRQLVQTNVLMASVGRIQAYCDLQSEAALSLPQDEQCKKKGWPQEGKIELNKVYMKYRANTEYVIRDLSLNAQPGEKIGCVGRTGAGKSSIIQILFRMVEIDRTAEGTDKSYVNIDGVNSQSLGLHTVRNSISIIPQTPFVFTGTVRRNLDPIGQFTDEQLWKVLEDVNLKTHVELLEGKLDTDMTNASSVFSVGQKQLICLARAILKQTKILVLDEATANVDMETDNFIQKQIKEKFGNCTIFTIAHRLSTIANYDKVLVLDKGEKVEFDAPYKLLVKEIGDDHISNVDGHFASMVLNTGSKTSKEILRIAKAKYLESLEEKME